VRLLRAAMCWHRQLDPQPKAAGVCRLEWPRLNPPAECADALAQAGKTVPDVMCHRVLSFSPLAVVDDLRKEVIDTMKGLLMGINDTQRSIARTMGIQGEIERSIMGDQEIADSLDYVAKQLERPAATLDHALTWIDDQSRESHVREAEPIAIAHVDSRLQSSKPREAANDTYRQVSTPDDAYLRAARRELGLTPWTIKRLAEVLEMSETSARNLRGEWQIVGLVRESRLGRWCFTEGEA
jgi:hypothetical protein